MLPLQQEGIISQEELDAQVEGMLKYKEISILELTPFEKAVRFLLKQREQELEPVFLTITHRFTIDD